MRKYRLLIVTVVLIVSLLAVFTGCRSTEQEEATYYDRAALEQAEQVAGDFVRNSPTFAYDGIEDSLELISQCPFCWLIIYEFDSAHPGYGDRTGQDLPEQITHHSVQIYVLVSIATGSDADIEIAEAIMDTEWDMLAQESLN